MKTGRHIQCLVMLVIGTLVTGCAGGPNPIKYLDGNYSDQPVDDFESEILVDCTQSPVGSNTQFLYVSIQDGDDRNSGTSPNSAFKSIGAATSIAEAGTTILVNAGTYRETVRFSQSGTSTRPIVLKSCPGANVTVSGTDLIENFETTSVQNVYSADLPDSWSDQGSGSNQVFADKKMILESRFPHTLSLDVTKPEKLEFQDNDSQGKTYTINDSRLTQPTGYWTNAIIHYVPGAQWVAFTARITKYRKGQLTFTVSDNSTNNKILVHQALYGITWTNPFFLTGFNQFSDSASLQFALNQLQAGEWILNARANKIYLRLPNNANPKERRLEIKSRQQAFELPSNDFINIQGINIFGAGLRTGSASDRIQINKMTAKYVSHFTEVPSGGFSSSFNTNSGIVFNGTNSKIENSEIVYSAGSGVSLSGSGHIVDHCKIHEVVYAATDAGAISTNGNRFTITSNDLYNSGRGLVVHRNSAAVKIKYNKMHTAGLQTWDFGATYTHDTNGDGTEISYNQIYDMHNDRNNAVGIYLDDGSNHFKVENNLVYKSDYAFGHNPDYEAVDSGDILVQGNTLLGRFGSILAKERGTWSRRVDFKNNIFNKTPPRHSNWVFDSTTPVSYTSEVSDSSLNSLPQDLSALGFNPLNIRLP